MGKKCFGWEAFQVIRIYVICEGTTEETFVREVMFKYFESTEICLIPLLIGKHGHKGGRVNYNRLLVDIRNLLKDKNAYCITFFDFYGLPSDFPGKKESQNFSSCSEKSQCVLMFLIEHLKTNLNEETLRRFMPYVQMYEFESLLFSDPEKFASRINRNDLSDKFNDIKSYFSSPEER